MYLSNAATTRDVLDRNRKKMRGAYELQNICPHAIAVGALRSKSNNSKQMSQLEPGPGLSMVVDQRARKRSPNTRVSNEEAAYSGARLGRMATGGRWRVRD